MANFNTSVSAGEIASELSDELKEFAEVLWTTSSLMVEMDFSILGDCIENLNDEQKTHLKKLVKFLSTELEI